MDKFTSHSKLFFAVNFKYYLGYWVLSTDRSTINWQSPQLSSCFLPWRAYKSFSNFTPRVCRQRNILPHCWKSYKRAYPLSGKFKSIPSSRSKIFKVNVVSYPRTPGSEPVTLTPTIIEKKLESEEGQTIVIYAALAQVSFIFLNWGWFIWYPDFDIP